MCSSDLIEDREYALGAGEMFIIPPFIETYYEADSKNPWEYIWIGFSSDSNLPSALPDTIRCPEALRIFTSMKKSENLSGGKSAFLSGKLWELFSVLLENKTEKEDYIQSSLDLIHSEYEKPITVEEIAKRINLDRRYLSRLFKEKTGESIQDYLIRVRIEAAKRQLLRGASVL